MYKNYKMKIFTSYFKNVKKLEKLNIIPIGISRWNPKWFTGWKLPLLAPTAELLSDKKMGIITDEEYTDIYKDQVLSKYSPEELITALKVSYGEDAQIALLCYEEPDRFCHRHIVAEWINSKFKDLEVVEWKEEVNSTITLDEARLWYLGDNEQLKDIALRFYPKSKLELISLLIYQVISTQYQYSGGSARSVCFSSFDKKLAKRQLEILKNKRIVNVDYHIDVQSVYYYEDEFQINKLL